MAHIWLSRLVTGGRHTGSPLIPHDAPQKRSQRSRGRKIPTMKHDGQKGTALVEAAIVLPLLLLLVFGMCEFGRALYIANTLGNAAREGARRAAVTPAPISVDSYVSGLIPFDRTGLTVALTPGTPAAGTGQPVTVTVSLPFRTLTGMIPLLDGITLSGTATMRYEL